MRAACVAAFVFLCAGCATTAPVAPSTFVYLGTVMKLEQHDDGDYFIVDTRVDKVLQGSFSGRQFQFAINYPANLGIYIGKQYTIRAAWIGTGYDVDEQQWLRQVQRKTR
jgi:hypothetical protein